MTRRLEKKLYFKDSRGNLILGGSDVAHSFEGYLGGVTFHRRKCIAPSEVIMHMKLYQTFDKRV